MMTPVILIFFDAVLVVMGLGGLYLAYTNEGRAEKLGYAIVIFAVVLLGVLVLVRAFGNPV